jgi:hypothetical protein
MEAELSKKLRELLDRDEIWSVMLRYARGIDRCDRELVLSCYHDDAVDDHHTVIGTPTDFVDQTFSYHRQYQTMHHHIITNHTCELAGDDAHTETYYTFVGVNVQPPHLLSMGRYLDYLQRRNGVWKIARRVCVVEKNFELHNSAAFPDVPPLAPPLAATRDRSDVSYLRPVRPRPLPKK